VRAGRISGQRGMTILGWATLIVWVALTSVDALNDASVFFGFIH
jgi:hypothetical protein